VDKLNKKIILAAICLVMLTTIPIAAGMQNNPMNEPTGILDKTMVKGKIIGHHTQGKMTMFYALYVHYTIYRLFHEPQSGVFMFKYVRISGPFVGDMDKFSINGFFRGLPYQ
jgi:hypothetical protein